MCEREKRYWRCCHLFWLLSAGCISLCINFGSFSKRSIGSWFSTGVTSSKIGCTLHLIYRRAGQPGVSWQKHFSSFLNPATFINLHNLLFYRGLYKNDKYHSATLIVLIWEQMFFLHTLNFFHKIWNVLKTLWNMFSNLPKLSQILRDIQELKIQIHSLEFQKHCMMKYYIW